MLCIFTSHWSVIWGVLWLIRTCCEALCWLSHTRSSLPWKQSETEPEWHLSKFIKVLLCRLGNFTQETSLDIYRDFWSVLFVFAVNCSVSRRKGDNAFSTAKQANRIFVRGYLRAPYNGWYNRVVTSWVQVYVYGLSACFPTRTLISCKWGVNLCLSRATRFDGFEWL